MARQQLSGIQIPTPSKLNVDGEFTLDAAAGTTGQSLTSAGAGNTPTWTTLTPSSIGATTVGSNITTLTNPSVISWIRMNADNTVTARSATNTRSDLGLGTMATAASTDYAALAGATFTGGLVLATGTASVAPLKFTSGTVNTTPVAGVEEYDGTFQYFTPNITSNRGIIPNEYYYSITADATYTVSSGTAQKMFSSMTNGLALDISSMYEFEIFAMVAYGALSPGANGNNILVFDTAFSTPTAYTNITYDISYATVATAGSSGSSIIYPTTPAPSSAVTYSTKYMNTATAATFVTSVGAAVTATYAGLQAYASALVGFRIKGTVVTSATSGAKLLPHIKFTQSGNGGTTAAKIIGGSYVNVKRITNNTSNGSW
jgi:hypothetical protein